jgi:hypothetical protein
MRATVAARLDPVIASPIDNPAHMLKLQLRGLTPPLHDAIKGTDP